MNLRVPNTDTRGFVESVMDAHRASPPPPKPTRSFKQARLSNRIERKRAQRIFAASLAKMLRGV